MQHLTELQIAAYSKQQLSADDLLVVSTHLQACALCGKRLTSVLQAKKGRSKAGNFSIDELPALGAEDVTHLSYEQICVAVNPLSKAAKDLAVNNHLNDCRMCQAEVQNLLQFKQILDAAPPQFLATAGLAFLRKHWHRVSARKLLLGLKAKIS